ncbi:MAG: hypothetical protein FJ167_03110 [Gammaproteobacteria bacterium]|nr:hypothetical protein [Gammaproteobacteria bacterium]
MYANHLNPWARLSAFLRNAGLAERFLFAPLYGLGDRAAFYAYLEAVRAARGVEVSVVCLSGAPDPVAELFPFLQPRMVLVPKDLVLTPLELTHWVYGTPAPEVGRLFFSWHWAAGDGSRASEFEQRSAQVPAFTHKNLIKEILGLSMGVQTSTLRADLRAAPATRSSKVMLCPSSNTIASPVEAWWLALAALLRVMGLEPVFNVSTAASGIQSASDRQGGGYAAYSRFDGPVPKFLQEVAGFRGVITARSGMCELLALAGSVPYVIVSQPRVAPFWRLGEGFGVAPEASLHLTGEDAATAVRTLEALAQRWVSA